MEVHLWENHLAPDFASPCMITRGYAVSREPMVPYSSWVVGILYPTARHLKTGLIEFLNCPAADPSGGNVYVVFSVSNKLLFYDWFVVWNL